MTSRHRRFRGLALGCAIAFAGTHASADGKHDLDLKIAQTLFDEGRTLMKAGRFAEACPKLDESQRLDPAIGTLLNLALCHELSGRLATAWVEYRDAIGLARRQSRPDRIAFAEMHLRSIEPRLSYLTIALEPGAALPALEVRLDGAVVAPAVLGTPLPVDPGPHRVEARAPGRRSYEASFDVAANAERKSVSIPALATVATRSAPRDGWKRPAAWMTGGLGAAALGVGVLAGIEASSKWSQRNAACQSDACTATGLDADHLARQWALVSDVGIGLGLVGIGVSAYLFATSSGLRAWPDVGDRRTGVAMGGSW
jgi:hypothetical protein